MPDRRIHPPEPEPSELEETHEIALEAAERHAHELSMSDEATGHLSELRNDILVEEAKSHGEIGPTPDAHNA